MAGSDVADPNIVTGVYANPSDASFGSYTNTGATAIGKGQVVSLVTTANQTSNANCRAAAGADAAPIILGIATEAIPVGASGLVQTAGYCPFALVSDAAAIIQGTPVAYNVGTSVPGVADVATTGVACLGVAIGASVASTVSVKQYVTIYIAKTIVS